jgi:putative transcriptional regulator
MTKEAFDRISRGLDEVQAILNGTADPATYRVHRSVDVKAIRTALGLSQEMFAREFHLSVGAIRDWEQGRKQPEIGARIYLRVIARHPDIVRSTLAAERADDTNFTPGIGIAD